MCTFKGQRNREPDTETVEFGKVCRTLKTHIVERKLLMWLKISTNRSVSFMDVTLDNCCKFFQPLFCNKYQTMQR
jgi:hypothetical protein